MKRPCFNCGRDAHMVVSRVSPPFNAKHICDAKGPCIARWYREYATADGKRKAAA